MHKRIYIVEDEAIIALEIKRSILKLGYGFAGMASNYDDALRSIEESKPDLVLMDIMLSESKSGIEIAKTLNEIRPVSIIFLTSVIDEQTMQEAILTAPASYLIKPFRREELQSAILLSLHKASLQSTQNNQQIAIRGGFSYHPNVHQLFCDGKPIYLGPKERGLVTCLVQAKGDIVAFKILEETIWQGGSIAPSSLRTLIYRLHKKLDCKLIETTPTFGCRIRLAGS